MSDFPNIPELPDPPLRTDGRVDFARKGSVFLGAFPAMRAAFNEAGAWVQSAMATILGYKQDAEQAQSHAEDARDAALNYAGQAANSAGDAQGWAANAQDYADIAANIAAFVGEWSELTGPISVPASVYHSGLFWQLLRDLPDVTASEPGVTSDWASLAAKSAAVWVPVSGNATLSANVPYAVLFSGPGQTLTLPAGPSENDVVHLANRGGDSTGVVIARNGSTIGGEAEDMTIDAPITGLQLIYLNGTWRVVQ